MSFFKSLLSKIKSFNNAYEISDLEDIFIESDFGIKTASKFAKILKNSKNLQEDLKNEISKIMEPLISELKINSEFKPFVITLCGVNGSGKTTSIAKIAYFLKNKGFSVDIAACDTFRAAATEQLCFWAKKLDCNIFMSETPKDPASVAFDGIKNSKADVLIIDTAGRLHNNQNLMDELSKIFRVLAKHDNNAPHLNLITIDATCGQNSLEQIKKFQEIRKINGIILTKMDGASKGGCIVQIADEFKIPLVGITLGESEVDFKQFSISNFCRDII